MATRKLAPIHPGEVLLADFLEPMGVTQYRLAQDISVPPRRINEIVKVLTVLTAVFLPLTSFSGFFGMNFDRLPFDAAWFLLFGVAVMIGVPLLLYRWLRQRGWT